MKSLKYLELRSGRKIRLKEVAEKSGCDKNALSRLVNHPDVMPSAGVIDKLVQYLFLERRELDRLATEGKDIGIASNKMKKVINEFVSVYPDHDEFWNILPAGLSDDPSTSVETLWSIYDNFKAPEEVKKFVASDDHKNYKSVLAKLMAAGEKYEGRSEAEVTLTSDEVLFLIGKLPLLMTLLVPKFEKMLDIALSEKKESDKKATAKAVKKIEKNRKRN